MEVLEQLNLVDLMEMARTSRYYESMASNVFKRKYSHKLLGVTDKCTEAVFIPSLNSEMVEIDFELAEKVFRTFGHVIQKVIIYFDKIKENQSRKIIEYIEQHCSKSLMELYFLGFTENPLQYFSNSLDKVELISFIRLDGNKTVSIGNDTVKITDIFPALHHLIFMLDLLSNRTSMNLVYPHLTELNVMLTPCGLDRATLEKILMKNPQIQDLTIQPATRSLMRKVSGILPHLEALTLAFGWFPERSTDEIRFKNVKKLGISFPRYPPANFVFDQVEEVQFAIHEGYLTRG